MVLEVAYRAKTPVRPHGILSRVGAAGVNWGARFGCRNRSAGLASLYDGLPVIS